METNTNIFEKFFHIIGSYPTYEEWKRIIVWTVSSLNISSYPTYEEWKQHFYF